MREYKYRAAPMPAWFEEKLEKKSEQQETAIERDLKSGFAKIISYNAKTTETIVELQNGLRVPFYQKIVEEQNAHTC